MPSSIRRVVTGHDANGRAVITSDGAPPATFPIQALPGLVFTEIWRTHVSPAPIDNSADPTIGPLRLGPTSSGSVIRVVEMPPDSQQQHEAAAGVFAEIRASHASTAGSDPSKASGNALMHRTETIDYGIVISGEIWLVLDDSETRLLPGDIVVQRGTNHAWSNRTNQPARMAFILLDGKFSPELASVPA